MGKTKLSTDLRDLLALWDEGIIQPTSLFPQHTKKCSKVINRLRDKWHEFLISEGKNPPAKKPKSKAPPKMVEAMGDSITVPMSGTYIKPENSDDGEGLIGFAVALNG